MVSVSVIIPVYNAEKYLKRCLDSVCNQTLKDMEIICVDDCSTDNSAKILAKYSQKYSFLKVVTHTKNKGESGARNTGLNLAQGEFLGFVDNDDSVDLDFYEKLYNLAKEENSDIAKAELHEIGYDGEERFGNLNKLIKEKKDKLFFNYHWWTAIYKTSLVKNNNINFLEGFPLGGDVLFLNKVLLASNKDISLVNDTFYHYYRRPDSGDSLILSYSKVKSVLNIHEMIVDNLINSDEKIKKSEGAGYIVNWCINATINYAYRNKTIANLEFCIDKLFSIYQKTKAFGLQEKNAPDFLPIIINYIENQDKKGLVDFFVKNNSQQKMIVANLRFLHKTKDLINA